MEIEANLIVQSLQQQIADLSFKLAVAESRATSYLNAFNEATQQTAAASDSEGIKQES